MNNNKKYELNVDNYDNYELFELIKYRGNIDNITSIELNNHIEKLINDSRNKYNDIETLDTLIGFLNKVNGKLLNYISIRHPVQLEPTNYNVIQSQNQLQGGNHDVTTDKVIPVLNVNEYKYPTGVLNPLEKKTTTKILSIDSEFRENYHLSNSSDFVWCLPFTEHKVVSIKLVSLELPIMWYSISERNKSNIFTIKTYNIVGSSDTTHLIEIPSGNYMASDFAIALTNYMFNKGNGLQYLICQINSITTKTMIRTRENTDGGDNIYDITLPNYSPDFYYTIDFGENITTSCGVESDFEPGYSMNNDNKYRQYSLGSFLGFTKRFYEIHRQDTYIDYVYNGNNIVTHESVLQSESSYGNGHIHYIFISIDDFNKNFITDSIVASTKDNYIGDNILGRVSINESFHSVMLHNASDQIFKQRDYLGPVNLNKLRIKILDKYGNVLDLNNNDLSMSLEITKLYS
jgi:hypothetical protein|tara:strand:+ start:58 stop:1440 length:1383 start_codon:yes stop_codon:yes gene_type:complete